MSGPKPIKLAIKANKKRWDVTDCSVYLRYFCPETDCHFNCPDEQAFRSHMQENHLVISSSEIKAETNPHESEKAKSELVDAPKKSGIVVECMSCGFAFNSVPDLRQHVQAEHANIANAPKRIVEPKKESITIAEEIVPDDNDDDEIGNNDASFDDVNIDDDGEDDHISPTQEDDDFVPDDDSNDDDFVLREKPKTCKRKRNTNDVPIINFKGVVTDPPKGPVTKLRCNHCGQDYRSYFFLKSHHEKEHPKEPIKFTKRIVNVLNEMTGEEELIREVSGEETTFKCTHCDYVTTHQHMRGVHMQKEHGDSSKIVMYKCYQCNFKCKQKRSLTHHMEAHKSGKLASQRMVFKFVEGPPPPGPIKVKFKDVNPAEEKDLIITPTIVVLTCLVCTDDKEFRNFHSMKVHFERIHPGHELKFKKRVIKGNDGLEDAVAGDTNSADGEASEIYKCDHCDYITHMADLRGLHMEKEHKDSSKLVFFSCDKCKYRTKSRGNLVNHKRIVHENYRPKKCEQCDRRFATKALLDDHVMRAHTSNEILCNDCGKLFASPSMLKRHELWHHNPEKAGGPVPCDICGKISIHRFALQKHINRVHRKHERDGSDIVCYVCGKGYSERRTLQKHITKAHGIL